MPNELAREAWWFLEPYVLQADAYVFSREAFVWEELDPAKRAIIAPSIDVVLAQERRARRRRRSTRCWPPRACAAGGDGQPSFRRLDGRAGQVRRRATMLETRRWQPDDRYVLQVSRWDSLKDPIGVIEGFAEHVAPHTDAHLIYAGPDVERGRRRSRGRGGLRVRPRALARAAGRGARARCISRCCRWRTPRRTR